MQKELKALLKAKQPGAIGYNGGGISANPARWSKTEGDVPPGPGAPTAPGAGAANSSGIDVWSTGCNNTGEKTVFLSHLKCSFYQDRLGTNIGKTQKRTVLLHRLGREQPSRGLCRSECSSVLPLRH